MSDQNDHCNRQPFEGLPQQLTDKLEGLRRKVCHPETAGRLWDIMSEEDVPAIPDSKKKAVNQYRSAARLWQAVHHCSYEEALIRAAGRLNFIYANEMDSLLCRIIKAGIQLGSSSPSELVGLPETVAQSILEAKYRHKLVVINGDQLRLVYWENQLIPVQWLNKNVAWRFLWSVVKAHHRRTYARDEESSNRNRMKERRYKLKESLEEIQEDHPAAMQLVDAIVKGPEPATYRFNLEYADVWARSYDGGIEVLDEINQA